ncbi:conserved hypothetical protein [Ricinus communis]|uniref:Uncharacterized protein n=1 Tax=Ricinus communis TaxID=3988 RepID=B9RRK7_RICCO|nr:conserved hypothetical protein [Ricinus communis]
MNDTGIQEEMNRLWNEQMITDILSFTTKIARNVEGRGSRIHKESLISWTPLKA